MHGCREGGEARTEFKVWLQSPAPRKCLYLVGTAEVMPVSSKYSSVRYRYMLPLIELSLVFVIWFSRSYKYAVESLL
jgi:hypothetical protein